MTRPYDKLLEGTETCLEFQNVQNERDLHGIQTWNKPPVAFAIPRRSNNVRAGAYKLNKPESAGDHCDPRAGKEDR